MAGSSSAREREQVRVHRAREGAGRFWECCQLVTRFKPRARGSRSGFKPREREQARDVHRNRLYKSSSRARAGAGPVLDIQNREAAFKPRASGSRSANETNWSQYTVRPRAREQA